MDILLSSHAEREVISFDMHAVTGLMNISLRTQTVKAIVLGCFSQVLAELKCGKPVGSLWQACGNYRAFSLYILEASWQYFFYLFGIL